jgi:hypothetical protein
MLVRQAFRYELMPSREQAIPRGGAVGIDMGIARFATLSDGTFYAPLNSFKRHEAALCKAQQAMSRKVKSSNNWRCVFEKIRTDFINGLGGRKRSSGGEFRPLSPLYKSTIILG